LLAELTLLRKKALTTLKWDFSHKEPWLIRLAEGPQQLVTPAAAQAVAVDAVTPLSNSNRDQANGTQSNGENAAALSSLMKRLAI